MRNIVLINHATFTQSLHVYVLNVYTTHAKATSSVMTFFHLPSNPRDLSIPSNNPTFSDNINSEHTKPWWHHRAILEYTLKKLYTQEIFIQKGIPLIFLLLNWFYFCNLIYHYYMKICWNTWKCHAIFKTSDDKWDDLLKYY